MVIGDAPSERILRRAGVDSAMALVSATSSDIVNLETAMQARAMRGEDLRIVLRLFDDDLARRVSATLGNVVSRSVSYLAAPAFAVAMLEHKVLRTVPVGRHVFLIADVRVEEGSDIAGQFLADLERDGQSRVLAMAERGTPRFNWSPRRDRPPGRRRPGDRARHPGRDCRLSWRKPSAGHRPVTGASSTEYRSPSGSADTSLILFR